jgi:hypothetical protein
MAVHDYCLLCGTLLVCLKIKSVILACIHFADIFFGSWYCIFRAVTGGLLDFVSVAELVLYHLESGHDSDTRYLFATS